MAFAVYHMEKGKGGSGGIGRHIDRLESKNEYTTFEHSDNSKRHLNLKFKLNEHCGKPLSEAIEDRIKQGYTKTKAIRKDAVKFQTHVLTGSHENMKQIFLDKETADLWIQANINWMSLTYGRENIVRFVVHLDEKTPHIHAVTVPITCDGGLSAKSYADGKKALRDLQSDYAKEMQSFGLERGEKRIGVKHESAVEYYIRQKKMDELAEQPQMKPIEPKTSLFGTNIGEVYAQSKNIALNAVYLSQQVDDLKQENQKLSSISKKAMESSQQWLLHQDSIIKNRINALTKTYEEERNENFQTIKQQEAILNDPNLLQMRIQELEQEKRNSEEKNNKILLDQIEKNILREVSINLEKDMNSNLVYLIDHAIRKYSPKEKMNTNNAWHAMDLITENQRDQFEAKLYNKVQKMQQELSEKRQQEDQEKSRSRGFGFRR